MSNVTYLGYIGDNNGSASYTVSGANLGTATADRRIVLAFTIASGHNIDSVTVAGVSASFVVGDTTGIGAEIWAADVPTGTSGDIVVTAGGIGNSMSWYGVRTRSATEADATSNDNSSSLTVDSKAGGSVIMAISTRTDSSFGNFTWSGASTPTNDVQHVFGGSIRYGATGHIPVGNSDSVTNGTISVANATDFNSIVAVSYFGPDVELDVPSVDVALAGAAPTVEILTSVQVDVPSVDVQAAGLAPTIAIDALVNVPAADVGFAGNAPALAIDVRLNAPAAAVVNAGVAPNIAIDQLFAVPVADVSIEATAPSLLIDTALSVPLATITVETHVASFVWEAVEPTVEIWADAAASPETWQDAAASSEVWADASVNSETWTDAPAAPDWE